MLAGYSKILTSESHASWILENIDFRNEAGGETVDSRQGERQTGEVCVGVGGVGGDRDSKSVKG